MQRIALVGFWLMVMASSATADAGSLRCVAVFPAKTLEMPKPKGQPQMSFLVLQIANVGQKPVPVDLAADVILNVRVPDGRTLRPGLINGNQPGKGDFVLLSPKRSVFLSVDFLLTRSGETLLLSGKLANGVHWFLPEFPAKPGRYQMSLWYQPHHPDASSPSIIGDAVDHWRLPEHGIETKPVVIELQK